jgi:hypothetical protein
MPADPPQYRYPSNANVKPNGKSETCPLGELASRANELYELREVRKIQVKLGFRKYFSSPPCVRRTSPASASCTPS